MTKMYTGTMQPILCTCETRTWKVKFLHNHTTVHAGCWKHMQWDPTLLRLSASLSSTQITNATQGYSETSVSSGKINHNKRVFSQALWKSSHQAYHHLTTYTTFHEISTWFCCALFCCGHIISSFRFLWCNVSFRVVSLEQSYAIFATMLVS